MAYCPFSLVKEVVKERKVDDSGKVLKEKETPTFHLLECLLEKCEVYDLAAKKCSLPILVDRIQTLQDIETKARQATSDLTEANSALLADLLESSSGILTEAKGQKEAIAKLLESGGVPGGGGAGLDAESKEALHDIRETLQGTRQSIDHIFSLLPEVLKESQMPLASFAEANTKGLSELKDSLAKSQEGVQQGLKDLAKATKESKEALVEAHGKEAAALKETITNLGDYLGEAQKGDRDVLSSSLKAGNDKVEKALQALPQRLQEVQEPLFSKFAEENKSAFDLFLQGATETTLSLTQLRQTSEKSNEILNSLAAQESDAAERTQASLARLSESIRSANEETLAKNSELFSLYLGDLVSTIKTGQAESTQSLAQRLDTLADSLKSNQDNLTSMLLESAEKTQGSLKDLLDSNAKTREALLEFKSSLLEAQKEGAIGTAEVLKRLQSEARTAQEETATTLSAAITEGFDKNTAQWIAHASQLQEGQAKQQEALFGALAGNFTEALNAMGDKLSEAQEKQESAANDKRTQVQATMGENRQAVEKLHAALEENATNQWEALKDLAEKLEVLRATLERQSVLESDAFETLGQRVVGQRDETRRSTEALLTALAEGQKAQGQAAETLRAALQESAAQTREALAGPREREAMMEKITQDIAASTQAMGAFLEAQRKQQEEGSAKLKHEEARLHNDRGVSLYYQQAYGGAEAEFRRALELAPEMVEVYNNLALTMTELGKHEDAQACFRRALELAPDFAEAMNNLGCLYQTMGEHAKAVETFKDALTKRVDYAAAYANLGSAYQAMNKVDDALKAWEHALELDPANDKVKKKVAQLKGS